MEQLALLDTNVSKQVWRQVERLLSNYRTLEAIIEAMEEEMKLDKPEYRQNMTTNYAPSESQRSNQFHSQTETQALLPMKIEEKQVTKKKLDILFKSLRPIQQEIWERRYVQGLYDEDVIKDLNISRRKYYRDKRNMIMIVAEAFRLL